MKECTRFGALVVLGALASAAAMANEGAAERPAFYKDILPILQENCQECHRPAGANFGGMVAPMSLMTFEETRPWAKAIAKQVSEGEMPPWDAAKEFHGVFANERSLTKEQIETIVRWTSTGTRAGNPEDAPPSPEFETVDGWLMGKPDQIVTMPEPYFVDDDVVDQYTAFYVDLNDETYPEERYIRGFQCKPGDGTKIVHHFNLHVLPPDENGELPPGPDSPISSAISPQGAGQYLGGVSSGTDANLYPEGYGFLLPKGSRITFDIHYHKEAGPGTGVWDQSSIGFLFTEEPPKNKLSGKSIIDLRINLEPGDADYQIGPVATVIKEDSEVINLMPHMHMRGKRAKFEAFYPDGTSEVLLYVPRYDFAWQTVYYYDQYKFIPKGTKIEFTAWYDNSADYAAQRGFDSTQKVTFGQSSTDEMMMGFMTMAPKISESD